jgi:acetylornithine deacetylase
MKNFIYICINNIFLYVVNINFLYHQAVRLLKGKIAIPSLSGNEQAVAAYLSDYLTSAAMAHVRIGNNICAYSPRNKDGQKLLMLNSHIDTVKPANGYTRNPFEPPETDGKLFGLGSNDAGASLVAMIQSFMYLSAVDLPFNLLLVLSCEEETSGANGMKRITQEIKNIDCAIVGEPTGMRAAVAERGLLVIDGTAQGVVGHAARDEGINAVYTAIDDISYIKNYTFDRISPLMGTVKKTVTIIHGGSQHNVIPDVCTFTVDVRPNECYAGSEILELLQSGVKSRLQARSLDHKCSFTPPQHPLLRCAQRLAIETCISPTTSDWVRLHVPAIKMGPGNSARSHTADEFVFLHEIKDGIEQYIRFVEALGDVW